MHEVNKMQFAMWLPLNFTNNVHGADYTISFAHEKRVHCLGHALKSRSKAFLPWLVLAPEKKGLVSLVAFGITCPAHQRLGHLEPGSVSPPLCTQPVDNLELDQPCEDPDT